jgi:Ni,Fe-hydrogenase maturation factor
MKILALGNEFIKEDSFAKEIAKSLSSEHEIVNVKDSFQFLDEIRDSNDQELVIIDVVKNLKEVKSLKIQDLSSSKILTAHDMDAGFFLQLLNPNIKIIGLPQNPNQEDKQKILKEVQSHLTFKK